MDLFQRAVDMLDRAQDRMAQAGNQAARIVLSAAQVRALEAHQMELRHQLEMATTDLGKLTFQRWKNGGVGNEAALTAACQRIDALNAEYQRVLHELIGARAAAPVAPSPYGPPPNMPYPGQGPYALPPGPAPMPPAGSYPPYPVPPGQPVASYPSPPTDPAGYPPLPPPAPPRPRRAARECAECYTMVPGDVDYCPSCGMRA